MLRKLAVFCGVCLLWPVPLRAELFTCYNERQQVVYTNAPGGDRCKAIEGSSWDSVRSARPLPSRASLPQWGQGGRSRVFESLYEPYITSAAERHQLDPLLIKAVIRVESDFDPAACSRSGARGLMQLMPETARDMQVRNIHDPRQNIDGGARYLRMLLDTFGQNLPLTLAAYNAGPERVLEANAVPPIAETQRYVRKVMQLYRDSTLPRETRLQSSRDLACSGYA